MEEIATPEIAPVTTRRTVRWLICLATPGAISLLILLTIIATAFLWLVWIPPDFGEPMPAELKFGALMSITSIVAGIVSAIVGVVVVCLVAKTSVVWRFLAFYSLVLLLNTSAASAVVWVLFFMPPFGFPS